MRASRPPEIGLRKRNRHSLHHYVVREIGEQILSSKFAVGEPIPAEATLCATLHISRTALREALIVLSAKGLIEARQKLGTVVRSKEHWNMLDADLLTWRFESSESDQVLAELYELRKLIEPLAASLAASHATRRDLEGLRKAYDDMAAAGDDGEKVLDPDMRFHRGVIAATGNSLFASLGLMIEAALEVNFKAVKDTPRGHAWALPLHEAVLNAIAAHDPRAARVAMQKVLEASEQDLRAFRNRKTKAPSHRASIVRR
jgi:GntR family transcriptional regulator, galactonate operon transcriptional repressor